MRKTNNKTTGKAKRLIMAAALFILSVSQAWAYDFSVVVPSGHTLYFYISSSNTVNVVWPNSNATDIANIYDGYTEPTGNLVIPSTVTYNGTTYTVTSMGTAFANCEGLTSVTIPNTVTYIALNAFRNCTGLTSVTLSTSLNYLGERVFQGCTNLSSVNIPNNVDTIRNYAFYGCSGLTSVTIGNSVTSIGNYAFIGCSGLTSVTIPNSVTTIRSSAFSYCSGLTSFTIPNSVTSIGNAAFYGTAYYNDVSNWTNNVLYKDNCLLEVSSDFSTSSYSIQSNTRVIADRAFSNCSGLTSVTIPNSVTSIGEYAFGNCSSIGRIDLKSVTPPSISSNSFQGVSSAIPVYIPCGSLSNYSSSSWDSRFGNLQESQVFSLGVAVNDSTMGMALILSNTCANTAIQAYPYDGYNFVGWSDGSTMNPRVVTLTQDTVFTAIFEANIQSHTITVMSANNSMGTVSGGGTYEHGTIIMLTATPSPGYNFVSWNDGNTDNPRTITVTEDATYIASFAEGDAQTYTITAMSANNSMGTVSGGGTYPEGTLVTLTATPIGNYVFVGWNDGNTDNPRTITVTEDATYIASFAEEDAQTYTITVLSANNSMGTVSGGGTYEEGTQATITATPAENHHFVSWNDGNTDNPRTITVTGDAVYIASFAENVSIDAANELDALTFYPNPTSGTITFSSTDIRKVEVMDAMGRMVATFENSNIIDLSKLSKGYYTMRITTDNGVTIRKVIRN